MHILVVVLQERKHLAFTLKDTKTIVGKLERIAGFVIHILMFFFYLVIFDVRLALCLSVRVCLPASCLNKCTSV